ncbi:DUF2460 domain-containing protein [Rhodobacteraceae bacterium]|nr:DUF2460 domain-containing protein [Paracoccaceae bacterium]
MSFHEIRFPTNLSFGSSGGPERLTEIVTLANGFEERNTPWADSRRRYDAGLGMRSLTDVDALIAFFEARRGQLYGFRWKDWTDYRSSGAVDAPAFGDQVIGVGDGSETMFQLVKTYASGGASYVRDILKPVAGSVIVGVDGAALESADFSVDVKSGTITLATPALAGVPVTAGFQFDVPVRFDTDVLQISVASFNAGEIPNVPIVEVRL